MSKRRQRQQARTEAFEAVVHHYEGRLLRYAATILNNEHLAQDVVQDVFIRLFRSWRDSFEPGPAMSSWLFRTAHNRAVDVIRKHERRNQVEQEHFETSQEPLDSHGGTGRRDRKADVEAALRMLPSRERGLIVLKVFEEKSYKEISAITGLTVGNVGYILHHAMRKLADMLGRDK